MVDMTPALNAMLSIRGKVQEEIAWIDGMVAAYEQMPAHPAFDLVNSHLVIIKTMLEAQDSVITMQQRSIDQTQDFIDQIKKKFGLE